MANGNLHRDAQGDVTIGRFIAWTASSRWRTLVLVSASLAATGAIDYATGYRIAFAPLYLFPVLIASTALGRKAGLAVALTAAIVWTFAQQDPRTSSPYWGQFSWNVAMRFATLGVVAWLITALETEMLSARQDYLTRLFNRRHFRQALGVERSRSARTGTPFSVLTIDLDNFKMLNDTRGHAVGDEALRVVAALLTKSARAMDLSARMGGDEFCVLLPGADVGIGESVARRLVAAATEEFRRRGWPLGLSIGIATTYGDAETADELLHRADAEMYRDKKMRRRGPAPAADSANIA